MSIDFSMIEEYINIYLRFLENFNINQILNKIIDIYQ